MLRRSGLLNSDVHTTEWLHDEAVIYGLGLALEETFQYLYGMAPTYAEFEQWILAKNGGSLEAQRIARVNAAITGAEPEQHAQHLIHQVENMAPVLSASDLDFWDKNGYVVVRDAVSPENCRAAEAAVWDFLQMNRDDPATWYNAPQSHAIMVQFFHHPALQANRESLRIYKAFAQLWQMNDLWVTVDRVSFNPPERPDWKFPGPHLHWDTSLDMPMPFGVQGLLYLTDTAANQGAFTCVPGFHRRIESWLDNLPRDANPHQEDLVSLGAVPIAAGAGDLIIWHQALPHGSRPNHAQRPRIVQYINMRPAQRELRQHWK